MYLKIETNKQVNLLIKLRFAHLLCNYSHSPLSDKRALHALCLRWFKLCRNVSCISEKENTMNKFMVLVEEVKKIGSFCFEYIGRGIYFLSCLFVCFL